AVRPRPGARGACGGGGGGGGARDAARHHPAGLAEPLRRRRAGHLARRDHAAGARLAAGLAAGDRAPADAARSGRTGGALTVPTSARPPPSPLPLLSLLSLLSPPVSPDFPDSPVFPASPHRSHPASRRT